MEEWPEPLAACGCQLLRWEGQAGRQPAAAQVCTGSSVTRMSKGNSQNNLTWLRTAWTLWLLDYGEVQES